MRIMLSTIDNPYDPFDDFKNWFLFDVQHGYNSCAYLARIAQTSDQFTEKEINVLSSAVSGSNQLSSKEKKGAERKTSGDTEQMGQNYEKKTD